MYWHCIYELCDGTMGVIVSLVSFASVFNILGTIDHIKEYEINCVSISNTHIKN